MLNSCEGIDKIETNGLITQLIFFKLCFGPLGWLAKEGKLNETLRRCLSYFKLSQVLENMPHFREHYRHPPKGGWSFSTRDCGWIVSDCTAEALKAVLLLQKVMGFDNHEDGIDENRLLSTVDLLLSLQNKDGGYATYETQRGSTYLEWFNPSEVFGTVISLWRIYLRES